MVVVAIIARITWWWFCVSECVTWSEPDKLWQMKAMDSFFRDNNEEHYLSMNLSMGGRQNEHPN